METTKSFRLYVIRHGLSTWNVSGRIQGHSPSQLTDAGLQQADAVGITLGKLPLDALYSSDLLRAKQTAECISAHTKLKINFDSRLREWGKGILEGLMWSTAEQKHYDVCSAIRDNNPDYVIPNGESRRQVAERMLSVITDIRLAHPNQHVAAIVHGNSMMIFLQQILGIPLNQKARIKMFNGSIGVLEFEINNWELISWGDVSHLHL